MTMAITRVHITNPTKITAVPASAIDITISGEGSSERIRVELGNLREYVAKPAMRVWIYAGAGNTAKAFDFGTVGAIRLPGDLSMVGLDPDKPRTFRLVIWDPATKQIVAANEHLRVRYEDGGGAEPLLPVRPASLGGEVWRLALHEDAAPELLVNQDIPAIKPQLRERAELYGTIVPEAVRQSLIHVLHSTFDSADEGGWQAKWVRFVRTTGHVLPDDPKELTRDELLDWVNAVVYAFAKEKDFAKKVAEVLGGESV